MQKKYNRRQDMRGRKTESEQTIGEQIVLGEKKSEMRRKIKADEYKRHRRIYKYM